MHENEIAKIVVNCCFQIHKKLGAGLFESVYEEVLCFELKRRGIKFTRQQTIPVFYDGIKMEKGFQADIIVEDKLIIEIKSVRKLEDVHFKQLQTYLKLTDLKLGLLVNFNEALIKNGIKRVVNQLTER